MTAADGTETDRPGGPPAGGRRADKLLWGVIGLLVFVVAGFYLWKVVAVRDAETRLSEAHAAWRSETRLALETRTADLLHLAALPLGFAVREAVLGNDLGAADAYLDRIVSEPGVERVFYADAAGTIRIATDEALVGRPLVEVVPRLDVTTDRTEVVLHGDGYHAVVPITGLNERLGVLVLTYAPDRAAPEETASQ